MKTTDKFVLVLVATLALFLAGCGGGSSTPSTPPTPSGPSPADMAITDAKTALATAQARLDSASTDAAKLAANRAIQVAASNLISVLSENGGTAADRGSAVDALNNAAAEIGRLERALAAAEKGNAAAIAKLLEKLDPQTAVSRTRAEPPGGYPSLSPDGAVETGQGPGFSGAPDFDAVYGGTTTVTVNSTLTAPNGPNPKLKDAVGTTVAGKNGWSGTMVTATDPATKNTDTVLVYSNIEAPKSVAFSDVFSLTGGVLPSTAITGSGNSNIQASEFSTGNAAFTHGTDAADETIRISGTYAGASGVYSCVETSAAACRSQGTNSGIRLEGGWVFEPSPGAMAIQKDTNYSYFGWWLRVDGNGDYYPSNFHGHNTGLTSPHPSISTALTGLATYSGPAIGKFAIAGFPNTGGHFTADASLSVDFGNSAAQIGTVEGAVTNFMVGGAEMPWRVDFSNTAVNTNGDFTSAATWTIDGVASAASTTNDGLWEGVFQRNDVDTDRLPKTATGTWEVPYVAASGDAFGHMIGAYGVNKDD